MTSKNRLRGDLSQKVADVSKMYLEKIIPFFPTKATRLGFEGYDVLLESYSQDRCQELIQFLKKTVLKIEKIPIEKLNYRDFLDLSLMKIEIDDLLVNFEELEKWRSDPTFYIENVIFSIYHLLAKKKIDELDLAASILSRFKEIPGFLEEAKNNLTNSPKLLIEISIDIAEGTVDFFKSLDLKSERLPSSLRTEVQQQKERALAAVLSFKDWLINYLMPKSNGHLPVGKPLFERMIQNQMMLCYDLQELRAMAESSALETKKEMASISKTIDSDTNWKELLRKNAHDHPTADKLLQVYKEMTDNAKQFVIEQRLIPIPANDSIIVTETPKFARKIFPYAAYIPASPFEISSSGEFWITIGAAERSLQDLELYLSEHTYHQMPLIVLHETYPGHHVQCVSVREIDSDFVKRSGSSICGEGWAFYCEQMMLDHGFYSHPMTRLLQLRDKLKRIARVIIDIDLQTEKKSLQETVEYLIKELDLSSGIARAEVCRYVRQPTQPMSYFIGMQEILKLRDAYQKKKKNFNLYNFHKNFLESGIIPIKLIEKRLIDNG